MTDRPRAYGPASALEGIRVLDLSTVVAGPGAARYLADFGADVIKVERPGGDSTRSMGWKLADDADSLYWKLVNRGKRTISLDLKAPADRAVMVRLVDQADVLFENMRPGRLEKMGSHPTSCWSGTRSWSSSASPASGRQGRMRSVPGSRRSPRRCRATPPWQGNRRAVRCCLPSR
jgi:crotonobetainyl-CoA:carnitine CoA-transferase CaiB-like acyl-CoA transferase